MNIKLKAAIDTAVIVGVGLVGSGLFALGIAYVPVVALTVMVGVLVYFLYQFNLQDLEMKEKYPNILKEENKQ